MNSPRTLVLSIAATAGGFILALVGVIAGASSTAAPVAEVALAPELVAVVAQEGSHVETVPYVVVLDPAASRSQAR
jgi:hypothetical protein